MQTWHQIDDQSNCLVGTSKLWQKNNLSWLYKTLFGPRLILLHELNPTVLMLIWPAQCVKSNKINSD